MVYKKGKEDMKNEENKEDAYKDVFSGLDFLAEESVPMLYQIVMHNDDFTPVEFVVGILEKFFYMDRRQAADKTLEAHVNGRTVCGIFSKDFAEAKIAQVIEYAEIHEHPLNCSMEVA